MTEVVAPEAPVEVPKLKGKLFPAPLPLEINGTPEGLQGISAQACNACHPTRVEQWSKSRHAAPPSQALLEAALGEPECLNCHRPLRDQWEALPDATGDLSLNNASFEATLLSEAVTCSVCHVRDGAIVVASEEVAVRSAAQDLPRMPHQSRHTEELSSSEACAVCHQLTLPGAAAPLYDTYGEWKRSGFEAIGITCQSCHTTAAADGSLGADHTMHVDPARAVTLELDLPTLKLVRGGDSVPFSISLTNTGAGHHFPTGTPFRGMRLAVRLEGPPDAAGAPRLGAAPLIVDLQRRVEATAPFSTIADTAIAPGASHRTSGELMLPVDASPGPWVLRITIGRTLLGKDDGDPFVDRRWPLTVE